MTNREKLAQASVEDVADVLCLQEYCDECPHSRGGICTHVEDRPDEVMYKACKRAAVAWLEKESEEKE
ncbi:MAG: hypothetical protein J6W28_02940 [Clostridia bacterium]|nr:hypothetical protein [Clostridia bacterium]